MTPIRHKLAQCWIICSIISTLYISIYIGNKQRPHNLLFLLKIYLASWLPSTSWVGGTGWNLHFTCMSAQGTPFSLHHFSMASLCFSRDKDMTKETLKDKKERWSKAVFKPKPPTDPIWTKRWPSCMLLAFACKYVVQVTLLVQVKEILTNEWMPYMDTRNRL